MGTIPLVESLLDPRNLATLVFYGLLSFLAFHSLWYGHSSAKIVMMVRLWVGLMENLIVWFAVCQKQFRGVFIHTGGPMHMDWFPRIQVNH